MGKSPPSDQYSEQETIRRRESAIQRMLRTPPKPHVSGKTRRPNHKKWGSSGTSEKR